MGTLNSVVPTGAGSEERVSCQLLLLLVAVNEAGVHPRGRLRARWHWPGTGEGCWECGS